MVPDGMEVEKVEVSTAANGFSIAVMYYNEVEDKGMWQNFIANDKTELLSKLRSIYNGLEVT